MLCYPALFCFENVSLFRRFRFSSRNFADPALLPLNQDNEPESWQPTDHIFYGQAKLKIERSEGVNFWEGAKEKSKKM